MTCSHNNKYTTGFGKVTYDYCPDCKQEVKAIVKKDVYKDCSDDMYKIITDLPEDYFTNREAHLIAYDEASTIDESIYTFYNGCFSSNNEEGSPVKGWSHITITESHLNYLTDAVIILERLINLTPNPKYPNVQGCKVEDFNDLLREYVINKSNK